MTKQITFDEAQHEVIQSLINKGYVYNSIMNTYFKGTESAFNQAKIDEAAFYLGQQSNIDRIKELEGDIEQYKKELMRTSSEFALNEARDRIKELEAELKRLIDTYEGLDYEDYEMGTAIKQAKELLK